MVTGLTMSLTAVIFYMSVHGNFFYAGNTNKEQILVSFVITCIISCITMNLTCTACRLGYPAPFSACYTYFAQNVTALDGNCKVQQCSV